MCRSGRPGRAAISRKCRLPRALLMRAMGLSSSIERLPCRLQLSRLGGGQAHAFFSIGQRPHVGDSVIWLPALPAAARGLRHPAAIPPVAAAWYAALQHASVNQVTQLAAIYLLE